MMEGQGAVFILFQSAASCCSKPWSFIHRWELQPFITTLAVSLRNLMKIALNESSIFSIFILFWFFILDCFWHAVFISYDTAQYTLHSTLTTQTGAADFTRNLLVLHWRTFAVSRQCIHHGREHKGRIYQWPKSGTLLYLNFESSCLTPGFTAVYTSSTSFPAHTVPYFRKSNTLQQTTSAVLLPLATCKVGTVFSICLSTAFQNIQVLSCYQHSRFLPNRKQSLLLSFVSEYFPFLQTRHDLRNPHFLSSNQNTHLCYGLEAPGKLQLVHTVMHGFAVGCTFWDRALAATTANADTVDNIPWKKRWLSVQAVQTTARQLNAHTAFPTHNISQETLQKSRSLYQ